MIFFSVFLFLVHILVYFDLRGFTLYTLLIKSRISSSVLFSSKIHDKSNKRQKWASSFPFRPRVFLCYMKHGFLSFFWKLVFQTWCAGKQKIWSRCDKWQSIYLFPRCDWPAISDTTSLGLIHNSGTLRKNILGKVSWKFLEVLYREIYSCWIGCRKEVRSFWVCECCLVLRNGKYRTRKEEMKNH